MDKKSLTLYNIAIVFEAWRWIFSLNMIENCLINNSWPMPTSMPTSSYTIIFIFLFKLLLTVSFLTLLFNPIGIFCTGLLKLLLNKTSELYSAHCFFFIFVISSFCLLHFLYMPLQWNREYLLFDNQTNNNSNKNKR